MASSNQKFFGRVIEPMSLPSTLSPSVFDEVLLLSTEHGASDIIFRSGTAVRARVNGSIQPISVGDVNAQEIDDFIQAAESTQMVTSVNAGHPRSFAYKIRKDGSSRSFARYRVQATSVNEWKTDRGLRLVCRPIPEQPPRLEQLNLPPDLHAALTTQNNKGIILISGETGSGKTTLLAATLDQKARDSAIHIATIEDPIEFNLFYLNKETNSLVSQSGLNVNIQTFPEGMKGLLRDNPDVIMVGEMRDQDTIRLASEASRTGHLVYSTLHVNSVSATVDRICVSFDEGERLAIASSLIDSIRTLANQELVPRLCSCAEPADITDSVLTNSGLSLEGARNPVGCDACSGTGYSGRVPLIEYLVLTNEARSSLLRKLMQQGMAGVTSELQHLVENYGQTKLKAAHDAFITGNIDVSVFRSILIEYQAMEFIKKNG